MRTLEEACISIDIQVKTEENDRWTQGASSNPTNSFL